MLLHYFAFGSNLHPPRLGARVPSARPLAAAALPGHALCWHKRGADGSGKCSVSARAGSTVWGAVYRLIATEKPLLDRAEALGAGYDLCWRNLEVDGQTLEVFYYRADPAYTDDGLLPFGWYHQLVLSGARYHRLPADYIAALTATATVPDPDADRDRLHRRLLEPQPAAAGL